MKITREIEIQPGDPGPPEEIVGIRCDVCGSEKAASKSDHSPRLDIDDGRTIHRADLCSACLAEVSQALGEIRRKMRPVTEWTPGGIRCWASDQIDSETGTILRSSSMCDEGLQGRVS